MTPVSEYSFMVCIRAISYNLALTSIRAHNAYYITLKIYILIITLGYTLIHR